jgi:hypothetical protein
MAMKQSIMRPGFEHKPTPKEFEMNEVVKGSANVYADLGMPNADEIQVKAILAAKIAQAFVKELRK